MPTLPTLVSPALLVTMLVVRGYTTSVPGQYYGIDHNPTPTTIIMVSPSCFNQPWESSLL